MPTTNQTIAQRASYDVGVEVQDVSTADTTGNYVDVQNFDRVAAHVVSDELADTDDVTVKLVQATASDGSNSKDLTSVQTYTADGVDVAILLAEAKASDLDIANDFRYVAAVVGATPAGATTINASALMERADGAYRP